MSGSVTTLFDIINIIPTYQKVVVIDSRAVCVFSGRAEEIPEHLQSFRVSKIGCANLENVLEVRIVA